MRRPRFDVKQSKAMPDENPDEGPLQELRAALDRIDHDLLGLLVRRMEVVGDIASRKRTHRVPIRDLARERRILDEARPDALDMLGRLDEPVRNPPAPTSVRAGF